MKLASRFVFCAFALAAITQAGEMLYNGIELPAGWPPNRVAADVQSYEPMRVPYLEQPPAVIPIDVGRQLFVDDFLIATTTLERRFHQAEPYAKNPILRPEKRWEVFLSNRGAPKSAMAFSDGCFYDPQDKVFKLWYRHGVHGGTCYTTSQDGINWQRPSLDVRPPTNVVLIAGHRDATTIWLDHDAKDPSQRFKLFQFHRDVWRGSVHTSPDGIHWSEPTWCGTTGDRNSIFYNPFRKVWVYSIRAQANHPPWNYKTTPMRQALRARKYWETPDLLTGASWKGSAKDHDDWPAGSPQFWFGADKLDPPGPNGRRAELYNLDAAPYESVMLGQFTILLEDGADNGRPKINQVSLGFSRDGYHWARTFRQPIATVSDKPTAWNYGNMQSVGGGCLIVGDRLFMYLSGRNDAEDSTGLVFFRRDGFISMDAGATEGSLTTRPIKFSGKHLFVNLAAARGELKVEVLDQNNRIVAPFSKENCAAVRADKTLAPVAWKNGADLSTLAGKPVKFRFHLRNGALYAFWVSPDNSGASHGFVAGGGPGFIGGKDTVGRSAYTAAEKILLPKTAGK